MAVLTARYEPVLDSVEDRSASTKPLQVTLSRNFEELEPDWRRLEAGTASPYQRYDWVKSYIGNFAESAQWCFAVLRRDDTSPPLMILPLAIVKHHGCAVASFIGGKHVNLNTPLYEAGFEAEGFDWEAALVRLARDVLKIDAYAFLNMPASANPLVGEHASASPSDVYKLSLDPDSKTVIERVVSASTRKKLRKKEKGLAALGPVQHLHARNPEEAGTILDAFFRQKEERFAALKLDNPFADFRTRSFVKEACLEGLERGRPAIELHGLLVGGRVAATYGGAVNENRFSGMFNSFENDEDIARASPGDQLLLRLIEDQCRRGRKVFDLGIGEARYKNSFCDEVEFLVDAFVPVTLKGRLYTACMKDFLAVKRFVKRRSWAMRLARMA